jgi:hypothetical protein
MKRVRRLCAAAREISPLVRIILCGIPDRVDYWAISVRVGDVILVETAAGPLDTVVMDANKKIQKLSQRVLMAISPNGDEDESGSDDSTPPPPITPTPITKR